VQQQLSFDDRPVIDIRVSARRRKTVGAHWEGDTIVITVPPRLSQEDRWAYADHLAGKLLAQRAKERPSDDALLLRALELSEQYFDGEARPTSVTWSSRQASRWGSCTPADGTIRISDRLKGVPGWVLDAVLVHELAHLLRLEHDALFHAYCARFPHMDASEHFLHGYALGLERARSS
jgi:predicted metal-dependent hydrolase